MLYDLSQKSVFLYYFVLAFIGLFCFLFVKQVIIDSIIGLSKIVEKKNKPKQKSQPFPKDFLSKKNLRKNGFII